MYYARSRRLMNPLVIAFLLTGGQALADVIHVPGDYPTIQAAINAANDEDIVEIANDTYTGSGNTNLDFHGKAITVRSASDDPNLCIIDCEEVEDTRCFYFHSGETADSIVQGLTLTHGHEWQGAGICAEYSSPSIVNCIISDNRSYYECYGGGVCCQGGNMTLTECSILDNYGFMGGALYCVDGTLTLRDCTIDDNDADAQGGALYTMDSDIVLVNCSIGDNSAGPWWEGPGKGGGLYCTGAGSVTLVNC